MISRFATPTVPGQQGLLDAIHRLELHTPALHDGFVFFARYGVGLFALLLLASWLVVRTRGIQTSTCALWAPVAVLLAELLNQPLVHLFAERRPYGVVAGFVPLVSRTADPAFPSDHAVMAGATAMAITMVHRRLGAVTWVFAALMAFARVYVGAHWPADVIAGLIFGAVIALVSWAVVRRPLIALVRAVARGPLAFLYAEPGHQAKRAG